MKLLILLPPSEGKRPGGTGKQATLSPRTRELLTQIKQTPPEKIYPTRTSEAVRLNKNIASAPTMPAIERYSGVVYEALDYNSLQPTEKKYMNEHVRIVSALFGLLTPQTLIPNYVLSITKLGSAKHWHEENSAQVRDAFVLDLLPDAHRKAVSYANGLGIDFTYTRGGRVVRAGHEGKRIKGRYVRWLAQNNITSEKQALAFREDGYAWNGEAFHRAQRA